MKLKEDPSLVHDKETVEVMNLEAEELNFGQSEETTDLMTAEVMANFMEFEYLLDEETEYLISLFDLFVMCFVNYLLNV
uniref:Uncharacterized protein n=1 Tax=Acrobeloides nanus TaxID=290746 RepID=A0A914CL84_9BILA